MSSHLGGHLNKTHIDTGVLEYLRNFANIETMIDVGCGPGGMVSLARENGIQAVGIDGDTELLSYWISNRIPVNVHDFREPIEIDQKFDLGWSVEFLEHVEEEFMPNYMEIFRNCHYVVCTAAPPGTPGHHHVNCQPIDYWVQAFGLQGLIYDETQTKNIRIASNMTKPFMQNNGMFFRNILWD